MTQQVIGLTAGAKVEILSSYTATNQQLPGVASAPAWVPIGAFYMTTDAPVKLEAIGSVTFAGMSLSVRLFDVAGAVPVDGSTTDAITAMIDTRVLSGAFDLPGGKVYQMQAQCIGSTSHNGIVRACQAIQPG